jgi:isopentenyl phosphate kinase
MAEKTELVLLKLGGSLITDKTQPHKVLPEVLERLALEILDALHRRPEMRLLLGHGSGSFGHIPASQYQTHQGVSSEEGWRGFVEVWREAAALNHFVMEALWLVGLPALSLPASAALTAEQRQVAAWNLEPVQMALQNGLLPVVYGDVIFDRSLGGTILSTEELFIYLARQLKPDAVLLAGIEAGVWADFPACTTLFPKITPANFTQVTAALGGSAATDVTGGMESKVSAMLSLVEEQPGLQVRIFSGREPGWVRQALLGADVGTLISADQPGG